MSTDRQAPQYVAQRKAVAKMDWDQCEEEYSKKGLCPNYRAILEARIKEHQAEYTASRWYPSPSRADLY